MRVDFDQVPKRGFIVNHPVGLAGTVIYVYAGLSVPDLQTLADKGVNAVFTPSQLSQVLVAFILLGLFPLIVRGAMSILKKNNQLISRCHIRRVIAIASFLKYTYTSRISIESLFL